MRKFPISKSLVVAVVAGCLAVPALFGIGAPPSGNSEIKNLLKERLAITSRIYDMTKASFTAGEVSHDQLLQAQASLLSAKLATCDTKEERVKVHLEMVEVAREAVKQTKAQADAGEVQQVAVLKSHVQLLEVQIGLAQESAK